MKCVYKLSSNVSVFFVMPSFKVCLDKKKKKHLLQLCRHFYFIITVLLHNTQIEFVFKKHSQFDSE